MIMETIVSIKSMNVPWPADGRIGIFHAVSFISKFKKET